jgi:hypothetical protein
MVIHMSQVHLDWLNKRYRLRRESSVTAGAGNDGVIEKVPSTAQKFVEADLTRCISSLALDPSHSDIIGYGVTTRSHETNEHIVSLYDYVTARMLGL